MSCVILLMCQFFLNCNYCVVPSWFVKCITVLMVVYVSAIFKLLFEIQQFLNTRFH